MKEVSEEAGGGVRCFVMEMFQVEKRDQNLTPTAQIERLTKPGHTYRNLNPFEVLQVDPDNSIEEAKKKFRRMSILVHPDKNQSCAEKAQTAFDAVKRAWNLLGNYQQLRDTKY